MLMHQFSDSEIVAILDNKVFEGGSVTVFPPIEFGHRAVFDIHFNDASDNAAEARRNAERMAACLRDAARLPEKSVVAFDYAYHGIKGVFFGLELRLPKESAPAILGAMTQQAETIRALTKQFVIPSAPATTWAAAAWPCCASDPAQRLVRGAAKIWDSMKATFRL